MQKNTRTVIVVIAALLGLVLVAGGFALGGVLGAANGMERPLASTNDWQPLGPLPGGAAAIVDVYAGPYIDSGWQLYVTGTDGKIYLNDSGAGWQEVVEVTPSPGAVDCDATMISPPLLPDVAVEARYVSVCHAELIDQYGFARMTDGSVWYWEDAYTGLYGFSEFFGQGLAGGALGCLCGGLLAGLLIGGAVLVAGRKKG